MRVFECKLTYSLVSLGEEIQLNHPDWSPSFDADPSVSCKTRDRLFDWAANEGRTWIAGHWAYPGMGRIVRIEGKRSFRAL